MPQILLESHCISYAIHGAVHLPKLLLLHGFMGCRKDFEVIVAAMPEFCCLTVDLPGHGQTQVLGGPTGYSMAESSASLLTLLQALNFLPCHLMGYSMGGRLALYLACCFPQQFISLLLESASPGLATTAARAHRRQQDERLAAELESQDWPTVLEQWYEQPLFAGLKQSTGFSTLLKKRLQNDPTELAKALRGMGTGAQPSLWGELGRLELPVSLVVGALDCKFGQINQQMLKQLQSAQLRQVEGCGHVPHTENPDAFLQILHSHLGAVDPKST